MPRSFLVKKAKYANDFSSKLSFYRQPSSPTEGETAPSTVHHYASSIASTRFSYGKFTFSYKFFSFIVVDSIIIKFFGHCISFVYVWVLMYKV